MIACKDIYCASKSKILSVTTRVNRQASKSKYCLATFQKENETIKRRNEAFHKNDDNDKRQRCKDIYCASKSKILSVTTRVNRQASKSKYCLATFQKENETIKRRNEAFHKNDDNDKRQRCNIHYKSKDRHHNLGMMSAIADSRKTKKLMKFNDLL